MSESWIDFCTESKEAESFPESPGNKSCSWTCSQFKSCWFKKDCEKKTNLSENGFILQKNGQRFQEIGDESCSEFSATLQKPPVIIIQASPCSSKSRMMRLQQRCRKIAAVPKLPDQLANAWKSYLTVAF